MENRYEYQRQWKAERIAQGLCSICFKAPVEEGRHSCRSCLDSSSAAKRNERKSRTANGMCSHCGKEVPVEGRRLCPSCAQRKTYKTRERAESFKRADVCPRCRQNPIATGKGSCLGCLSDYSARGKQRRDNLIAKNLCSSCGQKPLFNKSRCEACTSASTARSHGLSPERYLELIRAGCAICGLHDNLHIDHDHECCSNQYKTSGACVRGVLCRAHNILAGFLECPDAQAVLEYLLATRSSSLLVTAVRDGKERDPLA